VTGFLCSCAERSSEAEIPEFVKGEWLMAFGAGTSYKKVWVDGSSVVDRKSSVVLLRVKWNSGDHLEYTILHTVPQRTFQAKGVLKEDGSAMWFAHPSTGATLMSFKRRE